MTWLNWIAMQVRDNFSPPCTYSNVWCFKATINIASNIYLRNTITESFSWNYKCTDNVHILHKNTYGKYMEVYFVDNITIAIDIIVVAVGNNCSWTFIL